MSPSNETEIPRFDPTMAATSSRCCRIGDGALGAKSEALRLIHDEILGRLEAEAFDGVTGEVPRAVAVTTDVF